MAATNRAVTFLGPYKLEVQDMKKLLGRSRHSGF
ncbi:hypothetical protein ACVWWO_007685 [Bradyrhizobium sp. F1.13.1]